MFSGRLIESLMLNFVYIGSYAMYCVHIRRDGVDDDVNGMSARKMKCAYVKVGQRRVCMADRQSERATEQKTAKTRIWDHTTHGNQFYSLLFPFY